jgi:hypothetical protein
VRQGSGKVHDEGGNAYCPHCDDYMRAAARNPGDGQCDKCGRLLDSEGYCRAGCETRAESRKPRKNPGDVTIHVDMPEAHAARGRGRTLEINPRGGKKRPFGVGEGRWKPGTLFLVSSNGNHQVVRSEAEGEKTAIAWLASGQFGGEVMLARLVTSYSAR